MSRIAIIGAGAWGTALSIALARQGHHDVRLWAFEKEVCDSIASTRTNDMFLPGHRIPAGVSASGDFAQTLSGAEIVVSVMPSHHGRRLVQQALPHLQPSMLFVSATKGLENETLLRMTEVMADVVQSGRGFAQIGR